jgi:pimeloyl-ACP methyl ester carboxylesterase
LRLHDYLTAFIGYDPAEAPDDMNFTIEDLPEIPDEEFPPDRKLASVNLIARFGERSFKDTFVYLREFDVGDAVENITCPSLALVGEGEGGEPERQFSEFAEKAGGPVTKHKFTSLEGADTHCQVGNPTYAAAVALDWLDEIFD